MSKKPASPAEAPQNPTTSYIKSIDPTFPNNIEETEAILISHHHKHILTYNDDFILENKHLYIQDIGLWIIALQYHRCNIRIEFLYNTASL